MECWVRWMSQPASVERLVCFAVFLALLRKTWFFLLPCRVYLTCHGGIKGRNCTKWSFFRSELSRHVDEVRKDVRCIFLEGEVPNVPSCVAFGIPGPMSAPFLSKESCFRCFGHAATCIVVPEWADISWCSQHAKPLRLLKGNTTEKMMHL